MANFVDPVIQNENFEFYDDKSYIEDLMSEDENETQPLSYSEK